MVSCAVRAVRKAPQADRTVKRFWWRSDLGPTTIAAKGRRKKPYMPHTLPTPTDDADYRYEQFLADVFGNDTVLMQEQRDWDAYDEAFLAGLDEPEAD